MKKLMIAAAAAAMAGAALAQCAPAPNVPVANCASIYDVKMTVKTTKGVAVGTSAGNGSVCAPGTTTGCYVYRTKDSTKFAGYIYDCSCGCDFSGFSAVMWDSKRKAELGGAAFTKHDLNVMGKAQKEAEYSWTFTGTADYGENRTQEYTLVGAGLGSFNPKTGMFVKFSGNFAGMADASYDLKTKYNAGIADCICAPSQVWACDDLANIGDGNSIAYGTWSIKYNTKLSKKFAAGVAPSVPAYVTAPDWFNRFFD